MDLDEMKTVWSDMSDQLEQQKKLTNEIILKMAKQQYRNTFNRIAIPEIIGAIICFSVAGIFLYHFQKLDSWLTLSSGILSVLLLLILPILSIRGLKKWNDKINLAENTYRQTLIDFAKIKRKLGAFKKYSYVLGIATVFIILPAMTKIWKGKDLLDADMTFWYKVPFGLLFIVLFVYVTMAFYGRNINKMEDAIRDFDDEK